jgi:Subtilase family
MKSSTLPKFKMSLVGLATLIVLCPALLSPGPVSSDTGREASVPSFRNQNLILFKREAFDTGARIDLDTSKEDRQAMSPMSVASVKQTRVVQLPGPIKNAWIDALQATGVEIIGYVPNNAYIVRGDALELARVAALDSGTDLDEARPIRWMGRLLAIQKLDPAFTDGMLVGASQTSVDVEIELIDSPDSRNVIDFINRAASSINCAPRTFLKYVVLSVTLRSGQLLEIASLDQVLFVGPTPHFKLQDERSSQIVAGNLTADGAQPSGPGYISWLSVNGLNNQSDFVLDITDSGLDRGSTTPHHPDFFDSALHSRVVYSLNYATDGLIEDRTGHGTVVASIAGGLGSTAREDAPGYMYGLGVDPGVSLGASRIFDENGRLPAQLSFTAVVSAAYGGGARICNNSWGNASNAYDSVTQEYDSLVRDAQPSVSGNQEMLLVFSAGNFGPGGHVGSPATAKNVISVGASENYRPEGFDSCNLDGGGNIGPEGADNALDILRFSSGGPTADGRAKPDICAPGTHIYGAASTAGGFFGQGLCAGPGVYQPPDQSLYTWSSGTSFAAPHISGAASLMRRFFVSRNLLGDNRPPSPAMTKAYLINSASYMTGENAGGNLPGERQGWGLVNLSRGFDSAKRVLVDQTELFTESGQTFEIQGSIADRSQPLRVTLAWTDAPGTLVAPALVNDLDLELTVGGVTVYRGNNLAGAFSVEGGQPDRLNNVESIYLPADAIPAGVQGNYTVTVRAANIAGDGVPGNDSNLDQDFALVIYNVASPLNPPPPIKVPVITNVSYIKKVITIVGHDFTAGAQVEINGRSIDRPFDFDSAANSLGLRLKRAKLNLNDGDNQIVVIDHGTRSVPFTLKL